MTAPSDGSSAGVFGRVPPAAVQTIIAVAVVLAWQYLPGPGLAFWISKPTLIVERLWQWCIDGTLWPHLGATLTVMILGYSIGCFLGAASGLALGVFPTARRVMAPFVSGFYALPKVALAPLFIILFGIGMESKVLVVVSAVFFQVFRNTQDGIADIDPNLDDALRLMGASTAETMRKLTIPAVLPWIFNAMRISLRDAFVFTVIAELFASNSGLGYIIQLYAARFDAIGVYAALVVLVLLSTALTELVTYSERWTPRAEQAA